MPSNPGERGGGFCVTVFNTIDSVRAAPVLPKLSKPRMLGFKEPYSQLVVITLHTYPQDRNGTYKGFDSIIVTIGYGWRQGRRSEYAIAVVYNSYRFCR